MSRTAVLSRTLAVAVAASALTAPAALARPADNGVPTTAPAMSQNLATPDAQDAATAAPSSAPAMSQNLVSADAQDAAKRTPIPGQTGLPSWASSTTPIRSPAVVGSPGNGSDTTALLIGIGAALACALGGIGAVALGRSRRRTRAGAVG
jgi:hypothetical protein